MIKYHLQVFGQIRSVKSRKYAKLVGRNGIKLLNESKNNMFWPFWKILKSQNFYTISKIHN